MKAITVYEKLRRLADEAGYQTFTLEKGFGGRAKGYGYDRWGWYLIPPVGTAQFLGSSLRSARKWLREDIKYRSTEGELGLGAPSHSG